MFKHILIPIDGSPLSRKAAAAGIALAKSVGAKVTGFMAAPPATPIVFRNFVPVGYATTDEHAKMIEKATARHLAFIERAAAKARVRYEGVHVTSDYPADAIIEMAKKRKCDAIVMATSGQGGMRGVFIGSVAQKVLNKSAIPVLVIR
ncbi:MAG: universal stress protein [Alphaproteobacteria bacterium]|nr:universal stress protein [Alphaproteobacteria bacterium]